MPDTEQATFSWAEVLKAQSYGAPPGTTGTGVTVSVDEMLARAGAAGNGNPVNEATDQAMADQGMDPSVPFSPGRPLNPYWGEGTAPRARNLATGSNITTRPRTGRVSFDTIRAVVSSYDIARICIDHRIDDIRSLKYSIVPADGVEDDVDVDVAKAKAFLKRPDGRRKFKSWLAVVLENLFKYDAAAIYKRRNRMGEVIALESVDGSTIAPLEDYEGRRPVAPAFAFTQFANGVPWVGLTDRDLIYEPYRPQENSPYGLPPIEYLLLNANTDIRFQWHFLQYFTAGTIPAGFMEAPPDLSDPDKIKEWQEVWDAVLLGDQEKLNQIRWVPAGSKYTAAKDTKFDVDFPTYLLRKTCAAFGIVPSDLGFVEDVNRANGETQMDIQFRISTLPLCEHIADIITAVLQDDLGLRVEFIFDTGGEKEDRLAEAQAMDVYIKNGTVSPDWVAETVLGLPVDKANPVPRFVFSERAGAIPLKSIIEIAGPIDPATAAPVAGSVTLATDIPPGVQVAPTGVVPQPDDLRAKRTAAHSAPADPVANVLDDEDAATGAGDTNPVAKEATAGVTASTGITGVDLQGDKDDDDDEEVAKELRRWRDNSRSRVKLGKAPRPFDSELIPPSLAGAIWPSLSVAKSRQAVDAAFERSNGTVSDRNYGTGWDRDAVAKEALPKADPAVWPGWRYDLEIAEFYSPQIEAALQDSVYDLAAAIAHAQATRGGASGPAAVEAAVEALEQFSRRNPARLAGILRELYRDAWLAGEHAAVEAAGGPARVTALADSADVAIDWSTWKPGSHAAALLVADGGLKDLLDKVDLTIKGIEQTTLDRLGNALAEALEAGDNLTTTADRLKSILDDPARAALIAHTETARAMSQASMAVYRANHQRGKRWLAEPDACPICEANADQGPIPLNRPFASGDEATPAHPRCRCATAPAQLPEEA